MAYTQHTIEQARQLYLQRYTPKEIRDRLGIASTRVIYYWATKFEWYARLDRDSLEDILTDRIALLSKREHKTPEEALELDRLIAHHVNIICQRQGHAERMQQIKIAGSQQYNDEGLSFSENAPGEGRKKSASASKKRNSKNDISRLTEEDFNKFFDTLYDFQKVLYANIDKKRRNLLKARQIGATWYFAGEALIRAIRTGDDHIFISASRRQALIFRNYMVKIALKLWNIPLQGETIRLSNGAQLHFLGTNSQTAQSNSGHLYIDEYMWIGHFEKINTVAGPMATRSRFSITWFSTPSATTHPGYSLWSGDSWKAGSPERKNIIFPTNEEYKDGGRDCPDNVWRYLVTLEDAVKGGITDIDIEEIKRNCNRQDLAMLYYCEFVDDKDSVFDFNQLIKCGVDVESWQDHHPDQEYPLQNREIWAGFDPARTGDNAAFVLICVPLLKGEPYRVIKVIQWNGLSFTYMAEQIKQIKEKYNIKHIGIDTTGIGYGVYEMVKGFAPRECKPLNYSVETKNRLVLKMIDMVDSKRIAWDRDKKEIATAFLSVKKTTTKKGDQMTFFADRKNNEGHADIFFAIAHAMDNEPLNYKHKRKSKWFMSS